MSSRRRILRQTNSSPDGISQRETNRSEGHTRRGWETTDDSGKINKSNLLNQRDDIMSEYTTTSGTQIWIITRLGGANETTVLLPEER